MAVFFLLRGVFLHHLEVEFDESVEDYLLVGQLRHVLDEIQQEVFEIRTVDDEESEELVRLLECSDSKGL